MRSGNLSDKIRTVCEQEALFAYGTAYLFEQRAHRFQRRLRGLSFLGLLPVVAVGAIALAFQFADELISSALVLAGILTVLQAIFSLWAMTNRWEEEYSYARESQSANYRLAERFWDLLLNPPDDKTSLNLQFETLMAENRSRSEQDSKQVITKKEKNVGMRAALLKYRHPCAICGEIPTSMTPSTCATCGNF